MDDLSALPRLIAAADWPGAEAVLRRAATASAPAAVFYNLAKVLEMQGKPDRAEWLARAVTRDPGHQAAWFELGRARLDAPAVALDAFHRAATLAPGDTDAWRMVLRLALRLCDWPRLAAALAHLPQDAETQVARYRWRAETGQATADDRAALLADAAMRPAALKALTRVAKGALPLRLPPFS
jgi:tetratricopeptide (TPR) repeat protein